MYSRRELLMRLLFFTPLFLVPTGVLNTAHGNVEKRRDKFVKKGWLLREGDV
jgi:hypothetical protein